MDIDKISTFISNNKKGLLYATGYYTLSTVINYIAYRMISKKPQDSIEHYLLNGPAIVDLQVKMLMQTNDFEKFFKGNQMLLLYTNIASNKAATIQLANRETILKLLEIIQTASYAVSQQYVNSQFKTPQERDQTIIAIGSNNIMTFSILILDLLYPYCPITEIPIKEIVDVMESDNTPMPIVILLGYSLAKLINTRKDSKIECINQGAFNALGDLLLIYNDDLKFDIKDALYKLATTISIAGNREHLLKMEMVDPNIYQHLKNWRFIGWLPRCLKYNLFWNTFTFASAIGYTHLYKESSLQSAAILGVSAILLPKIHGYVYDMIKQRLNRKGVQFAFDSFDMGSCFTAMHALNNINHYAVVYIGSSLINSIIQLILDQTKQNRSLSAFFHRDEIKYNRQQLFNQHQILEEVDKEIEEDEEEEEREEKEEHGHYKNE